jgi:hypothetical protein
MKPKTLIFLEAALFGAIVWCGMVATGVTAQTSPDGPVTRPLLAGTLKARPTVCAKGSLYVSWDMPLGQQIFVCGGGNAWFQMGTLGCCALKMDKGTLDINRAVVPTLDGANRFNGKNWFANLTAQEWFQTIPAK